MNQGPFALFDGDGDRLAGKAPLQLGRPLVDGLGGLLERVDLYATIRFDEAEDVLGIGPIDADDDGIGGQFCRVIVVVHGHLVLNWKRF